MKWSFRIFCQWQDILNLFQTILFNKIFCFTETNTNDSPAKHINEYTTCLDSMLQRE